MSGNHTIRESLIYVTNHPVPTTDPIDMPVWEHVARALIDIAVNPKPNERGGLAKATKAQQMLVDRMVGRRRAGSRPITGGKTELTFVDLTIGKLEAPRGE